jgi:beta-phosphoglucomutase family hydrolase
LGGTRRDHLQQRSKTNSVGDVKLRLPSGIKACLFDLDGVLTETAALHAKAWKEMFDEFLSARASPLGKTLKPFDAVKDYDDYVDGRTRLDGTRTFLKSRGIELPEGGPDDAPGTPTINGLANRKNDLVLGLMQQCGVTVYPGSREFVEDARRSSLKTALVSSSANARHVLKAAGLDGLFDVVVDGTSVEEGHLRGKPAPDTYLAAASQVSVEPAAAAVFEDALAGVEAGRAGKFGFVVGVDRVGQADALRAHGADVVVTNLADLIAP